MPIPKDVTESTSDIGEVRYVLHTEVSFQSSNLRRCAFGENLVNVGDHSCDVRTAVLRHVQPDGLEISPEVVDSFNYSRR